MMGTTTRMEGDQLPDQISLPWEEFRKRKLNVSTPMYGGVCYGTYTRSLLALQSKMTQNQLQLDSRFMFNESLIQRARNYLADDFLRSDATHLLFVDADIGFEPDAALHLLALQGINPEDDEYDIICAPYPKKCISWEKIKRAVDKGVADEDASELRHYMGDYVINFIPQHGQVTVPLDRPVEIAEGGTGFMMIRRATFEKFAKAYPETSYLPDHARTENHDGSREIHTYFDCQIDPETRRYLSEDYWFCHKARQAGMKVWICPWIQLTHTGTMAFEGSLGHLASIGADPTANEVKEKKGSKK
jgi:hypothetical protein